MLPPFLRSLRMVSCACVMALTAQAQVPVVLLTDAPDLRVSVDQLEGIRRAGMDVRVICGPGAFIGTLGQAALRDPASLEALGTLISESRHGRRSTWGAEQDLAVTYLEALLDGRFDLQAAAVMDWGAHGEHALMRPGVHTAACDAERGGAPSAPDWTCTVGNNSEYMVGTVSASVFFVESNGAVDVNAYSWQQSEIDDVKLQLIDAWSIWSYTAAQHGNALTAVMDFFEPSDGAPVQGYEPVTHPSTQDHLWIDAIMTNLGRTEPSSFAKCDAFNNERRASLHTDHAYCTFVACNPSALGAPSQFTDGKIGYAYLGGPYAQLLYKANGWTTSQVNRVFGHETGHIFHAFDEYSASGSANCVRYFNGVQNSNFQGATCNGTAACVMVNNSWTGNGATRQWNLCAHTPQHLGWNGLLLAPSCTAPLNDSVLTGNPVVLRWNKNGAPAAAYGYVKIFDRPSGDLLHCVYVGQKDTLAINLVNGAYDWTISQGNANEGNGYAGVISATGQFTVNAPLLAAFTYTPAVVCAGSTVSFTNTSTGAPISWNWTFSGGTPSSHSGAVPPPVHYPSPGYYPVILEVGDGVTTNTATIVNAITVTGGLALPFAQNFDGGQFPPPGWTSLPGGQQGSPLSWTADAVPGCTAGTSAYVNAYAFNGPYGNPQLGTPRMDMTTATLPYLRFRYSYARESSTNTETLQVFGHDCGYQVYSSYFNRTGALLATNGGAVVAGQPWIPTECGQWREVLLPVDQLSGHIAQFWFHLFSTGGQNLFVDEVTVFNGIRPKVRVMLQGPYDPATQLMGDVLRTASLIPAIEPFSANGYSYRDEGGPHSIQPGILTTIGANAVVDWAVLELRDAMDPTRILYSRPVLLQRDGDVTDYDGVQAPRVGLPAGSYHVCIKHRNHLGSMTAAPTVLSSGMGVLDLSDPQTMTWGTDGRAIVGNKALLWSGDALGDGNIRYTGLNNDRDPLLLLLGGNTPNNVVPGYLREDVNMDGTTRYTGLGNDRDPIFFNIGSTTPNNVRVQQVP